MRLSTVWSWCSNALSSACCWLISLIRPATYIRKRACRDWHLPVGHAATRSAMSSRLIPMPLARWTNMISSSADSLNIR